MKKVIYIFLPILMLIASCGDTSAGNTSSVMVEKTFNHYNKQTSNQETIEYKACMENESSEDTILIMDWSNRAEEKKEGGWRSFRTARLVDKCPKPQTAHCAGGPDTGKSEFYYTDSRKILKILKEECTATYDYMTAEDKEIAARIGGKWTLFNGEEQASPSSTNSTESNTHLVEETGNLLTDSEQARKNVQNAEDALGRAFFGSQTHDKASALKLVKKEPSALRILDPELKKDKDIVLEAVRKNGLAIQYAGEDLKKDKEVLIEAVKSRAEALQYADENLKKDKEFILSVLKVKANESVIDYIDESLKKDKEVLAMLMKDDYDTKLFESAPAEYKKDRTFMLTAIKNNPDLLVFADDYIDPELMKDRDFILSLVELEGGMICKMDKGFRNDREIIIAAAKHLPDFFPVGCIDEKLLENKSFMQEVQAAQNEARNNLTE